MVPLVISILIILLQTDFSRTFFFFIFLNFHHRFLYRFVSSVLPPGSEDLRGDEVEIITNFKSALGIDDPDAANMHVEVLLRK